MDRFTTLKEKSFSTKVATQTFDNNCHKVKRKLVDKAPEGNNHFQQVFRIFTLPVNACLGFISREDLAERYNGLFASCYIFKFKNICKDKFTHGLFVKLKGFAPRGALNSFAAFLIQFATGTDAVDIAPVIPHINNHISLQDYLQNQYVLPSNLYLNYTEQRDVVSAITPHVFDHSRLTRLNSNILKAASAILTNIVNCPDQYKSTYLYFVLNIDQSNYRTFMRETTLARITQLVCQDAYNFSLQDPTLSQEEVSHLSDPLTKMGMVSRLTTQDIQTVVRTHLRETFAQSFVHPSPLIHIAQSDLQQYDVFDGLLFDSRFLMQLLLCARWFARVCLQSPENITNNQAHLLLYGQSGAGKSLLLNIIATVIPTYRYLTTGNYQNPDIFNSALLHIDEFDTQMLVSNQYKALLDIKSDVKIDLKNLHPENATRDVPCIISTNDDILTSVKTIAKKGRFQNINQSSIDAALRRLYIIPMKGGIYDKLHGQLEDQQAVQKGLEAYNKKFMLEDNKTKRIFNFIMAFAMFQTDVSHFHLNATLQQYLSKVINDFSLTLFGCFYLKFKGSVDKLLKDIESQMVKPDINDTEYQTFVSVCTGELKGLTYKFLHKRLGKKPAMVELLRDESTPWPIRIYYIVDKSNIQVKDDEVDYIHQLNEGVARLINDKEIQPFNIDHFSDTDMREQKNLEELECEEDLVDKIELGKRPRRELSELDPDEFLKDPFGETGYISDISTKRLRF